RPARAGLFFGARASSVCCIRAPSSGTIRRETDRPRYADPGGVVAPPLERRNSMHRTITSLALLAAPALVLGACANNARPSCNPQENANLRIAATDRLNPDEEGRPLPT